MSEYIFTMNDVSKVVPPNKKILSNIFLSFYYGAKIGLLGLNGSGKSTLLKIMAGIDKDILGEATPKKNIKIGYLPQEPALIETANVRQNIESGVQEVLALLERFNAISARFAEPLDDTEMNQLLEEQGQLQNKIDVAKGWELDRTLDLAADALRLPPWDTTVATLSGGEKRRVALCRLLLSNPDLLLLDEPTNHLDAESVAWLERFLRDFPGTVVAVTHDRYFLDNVAGWILELDRGKGIPFEGNYSNWLLQKEARLAQEERQEESRQRTIKAELEWVRTNPKGRRVKNKARLARFEELNSREFQERNATAELYIPPGPRLGEVVLEVNALCKSFGDRLLLDQLTFKVPPGAIVGIIGPNGAGKSTLFKMITGQEKPDSGSVHVGETVKLSYVDQTRDNLNPNHTVWQEISDGLDNIVVGNFQMSSRSYVGKFNFRGSDQQKFIRDLSGGERNRVHLAKLLKSGGNFVLLDEPTNDLDVETLRALEEAILAFPGCIMVISHDRWFLDRIATHLLVFEGESQVTWHVGNYSEYEEVRLKALGDAALQPHRVHFRSIRE
jgi:sulfate-transporting ATPase